MSPVELLRHYAILGKDIDIDEDRGLMIFGPGMAFPMDTKTELIVSMKFFN